MHEMAPSKSSVAFLLVVLAAALLQPSAAIRAQPVKVKPACVPFKPPQSVTPSPPPPAASLPSFPAPSVPASPSSPAPTPSPPQQPATPVAPATPPSPQLPTTPAVAPATPPPPQTPATPVTPATPPPPPAQPTECLTPLMGLMPCMGFLTDTTVPTPPATCCGAFKSLVDNAPICLCHGLNGDINKIMPAPMNFMRMMSLPGSCNVPLPMQALAQCSCKS
ncbi:uncharacterized protein [Lolium perenne]|uniref:uncharacterized protein n=1 Tax=Lolium perenne TaxID=4522 RepID=UPI003A9A4913